MRIAIIDGMKRYQKLGGILMGLAFVTFTGILFNVDPYTTTSSIRVVFFTSFAILVLSLIGLGFAYKNRK